MEDSYKIWLFKINQTKSIHTTFTHKLASCPEVTLYGTQTPPSPTVKYLRLIFDHCLIWAHHFQAKLLTIKLQFTNAKNSNRQQQTLKLNIKLLLYKISPKAYI